MAKRVTVTIDYVVPDQVSEEQIAERLGSSLKDLATSVVVPHIPIRTIGPRDIGGGAGGYETKLWEKATCKLTGQEPHGDPAERFTDPRIVVRVEHVGK